MNTIEDRIGKTLDEVAGNRGDFVVGVASWNEGMVIQLASDQEIGAGNLKGDIIVKDLGNSNENINTEKLRSNCNRVLKVKKAKGMALKKGKTHAFLRKDLQIVDPVSVWPELKHRLEGRKRYEDVTLDTIEKYILVYITDFERINDMERYKWRAIKHFQKHWDIEAEDFAAMLKEALSKTVNLLASGKYLPREMINRMATAAPEKVRQAFVDLYDLAMPFAARIEQFREVTSMIKEEHLPADKQYYQDPRAVMVYLSFRYPEQHYLYKYTMFRDAAKKLQLEYKAKKGDVLGVLSFESACEFIKSRLIKSDKLLKLHQERLNSNCYRDPEHTVLTQDFIYAVARHLPNFEEAKNDSQVSSVELAKPQPISELILKISADKNKDAKKSVSKVDWEKHNARLKEIGDLGERLVVQREKRYLEQNDRPDLAAKVEWVANTKGDGLGYDILSWTLKGEKKYIEVKSTTGGLSAPFYVTRNEMEASEQYGRKYYLYRVYCLTEESVEPPLNIYYGSLVPLCQDPHVWKVVVG